MNKLDLNKIEEKLDTTLENETTESLTNWLKEKRDKNNNMAQIEPVTIPFKKNWGEYLFVFQSYPFTASNQVMAEILDKDGNLLYSIMLNATSYEEVAQQLGLTLIKTNNMAQETLEEAAKAYAITIGNLDGSSEFDFIKGAKWQQEKMYSEEEVRKLSTEFFYHWYNAKGNNTEEGFDKWFEQFKKQ